MGRLTNTPQTKGANNMESLIGKIESYKELKARHSKEVSDFDGMFWAFSTQQFIEGMEKLGLKKEDTHEICSIGAGGFMLKSKKEAFNAMFDRQAKERKQRKQDEKFLLEALAYELRNHEYCITYDPSDALDALGLRKEDVDPKIMKQACLLAV